MPTRLWSGKVSEMKNNMITALDIGSSFVRVLIAKTAKDNSLEVLGSSEVPSSGIEKGIVKDIEAVSECVKKALQEAEKASGLKAVNIFTNITGEHIRSNVGDGRISIPSGSPNEPGEISQDHVDQVINDAKNGIKILKGYERATILHGIPQSFVIDGQDDIHNPVKMNGFHLITKVYTIFGDITPLRNLAKCIELAGYDIDPDNFVLNHIAVSEAVLTEDEKRLGTVLIDIGGGTCDISLFRKGVLEKVMVVPMAGSAITEDLAIGLKTTISSAEYIKKEYGNAYAASVDPNVEIEVDGISGRESHSRTQYLVSHVIQHRVEAPRAEQAAAVRGQFMGDDVDVALSAQPVDGIGDADSADRHVIDAADRRIVRQRRMNPPGGQGEHLLLGGLQRGLIIRPVAGAVLAARTEEELEELARQLVVLFVRDLDLLGDGPRTHALDHLAQADLLGFDSATFLVPGARAGGGAGGRPQYGVGDEAQAECLVKCLVSEPVCGCHSS